MSAAAVIALVLVGCVIVFLAAAEIVSCWLGPPTPFYYYDDDDWTEPAPQVRTDTPVYDRVKAERAAEVAGLERLWNE